MKDNWQPVAIGVFAQSLAVCLGYSLGLARVHGVDPGWAYLPLVWLLEWHVAGATAIFILVVELAHFLGSRKLRQVEPAVPWVCLSLALFAGCTMYCDPLVNYQGDVTFITGVVLMLPWLLLISPLVRSEAWLGLAAAILFISTLLSMLIFNACSWRSARGFFFQMVS
jgi:hypothetical protein